MKKMKFISWVLLICLVVSALAPSAAAAEAPAVMSTAVYLADPNTDYVYFERYGDTRMYPASLTKIMTAMLVIEAAERGEVSMDDMVTAQAGFGFDLEADGSTASILEGETMSLRNLVYCILMASANEACNIAAMYLCGDVQTFVDLMNQRAKELGCTDTHFANTHGLPNTDHYTTPHDMYRIAQQAMTYETFVTISDTAEYTVPATNLSQVRNLTNTNGLISGNSVYKGFLYAPAVGIKTGYTSAAGYCLVSSAQQDGIELICVVMGGVMTESANGSLDYSNYSDSIKLYDWVFDNYSMQELITADQLITEIPVELGSDADSVALRAQSSISAVIPNDTDLASLDKQITIYSEDGTCEAPVTEGQVLGEMTISLGGVTYGTTYLVANRDIDLSYLQHMGATIRNTLNNTWVKVALTIVVLIAVIYIVLVIRYRRIRRKRQAELREAKLQRQKLQEQTERDRVFAEAKRQSYQPQRPGRTPPASDVTRDYFEEFFRDDK